MTDTASAAPAAPFTIATWNLKCATRPRRWTSAFVDAVTGLDADIVVLTEYASPTSECRFAQSLREAGFCHTCVTSRVDGQNQVLIASRHEMQRGELRAAAVIGPAVPPNFLHVVVPDLGVDILGLRIPDYSGDRLRRHATWDWLELAAKKLVAGQAVLIGDFNADIRYKPAHCGDRFKRLTATGWQHAEPVGWSYWNPSGHAARLDHLLVSPRRMVESVRYVSESGGHALVGRKPGRPLGDLQPVAENALSDHAALVGRITARA
jgi:endonuclease/exonuclease/phosphatase family metal-dependent hydrolase